MPAVLSPHHKRALSPLLKLGFWDKLGFCFSSSPQSGMHFKNHLCTPAPAVKEFQEHKDTLQHTQAGHGAALECCKLCIFLFKLPQWKVIVFLEFICLDKLSIQPAPSTAHIPDLESSESPPTPGVKKEVTRRRAVLSLFSGWETEGRGWCESPDRRVSV